MQTQNKSLNNIGNAEGKIVSALSYIQSDQQAWLLLKKRRVLFALFSIALIGILILFLGLRKDWESITKHNEYLFIFASIVTLLPLITIQIFRVNRLPRGFSLFALCGLFAGLLWEPLLGSYLAENSMIWRTELHFSEGFCFGVGISASFIANISFFAAEWKSKILVPPWYRWTVAIYAATLGLLVQTLVCHVHDIMHVAVSHFSQIIFSILFTLSCRAIFDRVLKNKIEKKFCLEQNSLTY